MATPSSIRFDPEVLRRLNAYVNAHPGTTLSSAGNRLIDEALRSQEHPLVVFRDGPAGRRARLGLLTENQEENGRRRRLFSITDAGREELRHWLESPSREQTEVRDLGLLKLYFAGLTSPERIRQMADEQIALHEERLAEYDALSEEMARYEHLRPHQVPIRMGYLHEQAWLAFWQSVIDDPPVTNPRTGRR